MIDQITIDKILDAANIVDVVSEFVTLRKRGINMVGLCPFHSDKTPSFYVSPSKNICKCFACGEGGTAVHFIMKHEQLSYVEALKFLAKKYNIEVQERELSESERKAQSIRESLLIVNTYAQQYFSKVLHQHPEGKSIGLSYFKERGFKDEIIEKFQLGYSLEQKDAFYQEAIKAGYKKEYLEQTGLIIAKEDGYVADRFRGRVMFPVHTLSGKVVAFGGRVLRKDEKTAKYVNSPESEIYHKSRELYGLFFAKQAIVKSDRCFLVEGYTDVISMHQSGIENVVASSGTALTHGQIKLIHRFTNNITVIYDGDAAGIKAALRGIDLLLEEGINVKVVLLPEGEDPDSFSRKQSAASFIQYIEDNQSDFIRFKTNLLIGEAGNDPIKRSRLISDIVQSVAVIPDNIARSVYIRE
ncbi:MAG: DNA primase, partial [Tannerellaceae bacterium]